MSGYELFYASGGHFGPFETLEEAETEAQRRLRAQPHVYGGEIEVRESTTARTYITRYSVYGEQWNMNAITVHRP